MTLACRFHGLVGPPRLTRSPTGWTARAPGTLTMGERVCQASPEKPPHAGPRRDGGFSPTGRSAVIHPMVGPDLGEETKMLLAKLVSSDAH